MYVMLIGRPPFEESEVQKTYQKIRHVDYGFPYDVKISSDAQRFI